MTSQIRLGAICEKDFEFLCETYQCSDVTSVEPIVFIKYVVTLLNTLYCKINTFYILNVSNKPTNRKLLFHFAF